MKTPPLIVESFEDTSNYTFLTLIEFKKQRYLTIVENVVGDEIHAYVLDRLEAEGIDPDWFLAIATRWFYGASERYPLSFEFAKQGQQEVVRKVLKTYNINSTARVVGKLFSYQQPVKPKVRRRKPIPLTQLPEVRFKKSF